MLSCWGSRGREAIDAHTKVFIVSKAWMIVYGELQVWIARPPHLLKKLTLPTTTMPCTKKIPARKRTRCGLDPNSTPIKRAVAMRWGQNRTGAQSRFSRKALCHLSQISLWGLLFFTFCNFWTNQRAAIAFSAQCTRVSRDARRRRREKTCTNTLCVPVADIVLRVQL